MKAYLVALAIEPVELNRIYLNLPLHCTVMHWFLTSATSDEIEQTVRPVLTSTPPILLTSGSPDRFGPSKGPKLLPVNRLEPNPELTNLHHRLYNALEPLGIKHTEPSYTLDNFIFHVTKQGSRRFNQGSMHLATTAYLVEALDPIRIARKQIKTVFELT